MGVRYSDYPNNIECLSDFRMALFGHAITIWFQSGTEEWFELIEIENVQRNSSFRATFGSKRSSGRDDGAVESFHVCSGGPFSFKRSKTTLYRAPIRLTRIAYSDGTTVVHEQISDEGPTPAESNLSPAKILAAKAGLTMTP